MLKIKELSIIGSITFILIIVVETIYSVYFLVSTREQIKEHYWIKLGEYYEHDAVIGYRPADSTDFYTNFDFKLPGKKRSIVSWRLCRG